VLENACHLSVCKSPLSSPSFKATGPKFGKHNSHINGSKFTERNFDILSRSWENQIQSYIVNLVGWPLTVRIPASIRNCCLLPPCNLASLWGEIVWKRGLGRKSVVLHKTSTWCAVPHQGILNTRIGFKNLKYNWFFYLKEVKEGMPSLENFWILMWLKKAGSILNPIHIIFQNSVRKNWAIHISTKLKVLGSWFDYEMKWDVLLDNGVSKWRQEGSQQEGIPSSFNINSVLFYGSEVWFNYLSQKLKFKTVCFSLLSFWLALSDFKRT